MDNFVCVISNSVLIYNFHFPFLIAVVSKYQKSLQDEGDSNDSDDEENNWPELRYGIYKNPTPGPSWREDDEVSPNPA